MNKKYLARFLIIMFFLLAALAVITYHPATKVSQELAAPASFGTTAPYGKNSIVFSNGRSLVAYNYATGASKLLSADNPGDVIAPQLGGIDTIAATANQKYVMFHELQLAQGGVLSQAFAKYNYPDLSLGFWFVYNVTSQTYQLLPTNTLLAKTAGNYVYTLTTTNGSESINKYSLDGLGQVSSINASNVSNFYPVSGGLMLQSPDNTVSFTKDGVVIQTVFKSAILNGVSADGMTALATLNTHQLALFNIQKSSQKIISNDIVNQPVWSPDGEALYFTGSSDQPSSSWQLNSYDTTTGKHRLWKIAQSLGNFDNLSLTSVLSPNVAIMSKNNSSYYLVGNSIATLKLPDSSYNRTFTENGSGSVSLEYSSSQNVLLISWLNYDPNAAQVAGFRQLRADGYDPNLINIQLGTSAFE